jgi:hypothetical protein
MQPTLQQLIDAKEPLQRLISVKLPLLTALKLKNIVELINDELISFQNLKTQLLDDYLLPPTIDEQNPRWKNEFSEETYLNEINDHLTSEVIINTLPIYASELNEIRISVTDLASIEWLLDFDS